MKKRILGAILCLVMVLSLVPLSALVANAEETKVKILTLNGVTVDKDVSPVIVGEVGVPITVQTVANRGDLTWKNSIGWLSNFGLTLDPNTGTISGTPTKGGMLQGSISATSNTDSHNYDSTRFTLYVYSESMKPVIRTESLPAARANDYYSASIAMGGQNFGAAISWTKVSGSLPAGLTFLSQGDHAVIKGTPTVSGQFPFTAKCEFTLGNKTFTAQKSFTLSVSDAIIPPEIQDSTLPNAIVGEAYSYQCSATGTAPFTWEASCLPDGLTMSADGLVSGTPIGTDIGLLSFNATASNGKYQKTKTIQIPVYQQPVLNDLSKTTGEIQSYFYSSASVEGSRNTITFDGGSLPKGVAFTPHDRWFEISGTPEETGSFTFRVRAGMVEKKTVITTNVKEYTVTVVAPAANITPNVLPDMQKGQSWSAKISCDDVYAYRANWSISSGSLPAGVTMTVNSGNYCELSGKPTTAGTYQFVVKAEIFGRELQKNYTVTVYDGVMPPMLDDEDNRLPPAVAGQHYSFQFTASQGTAPLTWSISAGTLPSYLTLDPNTGVLSGDIPDSATDDSIDDFTIEVTNSSSFDRLYCSAIPVCAQPKITGIDTTIRLQLGRWVYSDSITTEPEGANIELYKIDGQLPEGVELIEYGRWASLRGTPAEAGTFHFTMIARRAENGVFVGDTTKTYTVIVEDWIEQQPASVTASVGSPLTVAFKVADWYYNDITIEKKAADGSWVEVNPRQEYYNNADRSDWPVWQIEFRGPDEPTIGTYRVKMGSSEYYSQPFTVSWTTAPLLYGDVDNSGTLTDADLTMLLRYVAKIDKGITNATLADCNRDGVIDAADVTWLAKKLGT